MVGEGGIIPTGERRTVNAAWIFDVDGVITNPSEKRITEPEILDQIIKRLENGEPVALNTGRSLVWMIDRVINPLIEKVKDKKILQNLSAVGEKGGIRVEFDENGQMQQYKDESISVPQALQEKVRKLITDEFSESMFYDATKETMISTEMKDGYPVDGYTKQQQGLNIKLQGLVDQEGLAEQLKVDPTTIATDIENKFVGKGFAVKRIIEWVKRKGIIPQRYIAFGDSFSSDMPMAQEIHSQRLPVEFVYAGKENIDTTAFPFTIHQTKAKFEKGTLEFLKALRV